MNSLQDHEDQRPATRGEMNRRFNEVDRRFDEVDRRFGEVDRRLAYVDRRLYKVDGQLEKLNDRFFKIMITIMVIGGGLLGTAIVATVDLLATQG